MNTEFSQEFKDFLKDNPELPESEHYAHWVTYQAGKLQGLTEALEESIDRLQRKVHDLRDKMQSTHLNLPSKQDALPDNLLGCDGRKFRCRIKGGKCEGVVSVDEGDVVLCQNIHDGVNHKDKKGFKYSWYVGEGTQLNLEREDVTEFELID